MRPAGTTAADPPATAGAPNPPRPAAGTARSGAPAQRRAAPRGRRRTAAAGRSEEHTSELQSLMRISYAVFCLKKKTHDHSKTTTWHKTIYTYTRMYTVQPKRDRLST